LTLHEEMVACVGSRGTVFPLPRSVAHRRRIHHLVVRVLATNRQGLLLVQRRSATRETYPEHYTDSASGHVSFSFNLLHDLDGELRRQAERELYEETGLRVVQRHIQPFGEPLSSDDAFETSYTFVAEVAGELRASAEVDATRTRFVMPEELRRMLRDEPFVPEAKMLWSELLGTIGSRSAFQVFFL